MSSCTSLPGAGLFNSGTCQAKFSTALRIEIPQPLWAAHSRHLTNFRVKKISLYLFRISHVLALAHYYLLCILQTCPFPLSFKLCVLHLLLYCHKMFHTVQHAGKEVLASTGGNGYTSGKWSLSRGFAQPVLFLAQNSRLIIAANGVIQFAVVL